MFERNRLAEITAGTHGLVDLDAYASNIRQLRALAGERRELMAIVKANAYGHGAVECSHAAILAGASQIGVARIDEALELREGGVDAPILVIGPPNVRQLDAALTANVSVTVATEASTDAVLAAAFRRNRRASVHLKIDTGLRRYGALPELAIRLARTLQDHPLIDFAGLYSHYSSADETDPDPTLAQIEVMAAVYAQLQNDALLPQLIHLANSAGIIESHFPHTNLVRSGIATYGLDPSDEVPVSNEFQPVLSVRSVITRRFRLRAGDSVSYNRTYTAQRDEEVAAIPIGYADGLERHISNQGWFVHAGQRCSILGRVCMDQTVVRVPEKAREGDAVTILGPGDSGEMTIGELGDMCETNTYEPVVRIAARVPKLFLRDGVPVSWSVPLLGKRGSLL